MAKPLTPKQQCFVDEYLIDLNATQAAIRAEYSVATARQQGQRLLTKAVIKQAVDAALAKRAEKTEINQEWVIARLVENAERAMQLEPVGVVDAQGKSVAGVYTYQGSVANKAYELIGKHNSMFADKVDHNVTGKLTVQIIDPTRPRDK